MYESFYGLREEPFRLSPDARLCFPHPSYKKARAYMLYALQRREGFVMITGRPGTGKTTLINDLTAELEEQGGLYAALNSTQVQADDLLRLVLMKFNLDGETGGKAQHLHRLEEFLQRLQREERRPLLIIDEAQDLPKDALEELRLLTNLQQGNLPLIQIFLVGQEELRQTVRSPGLEQLHQRIVAASHLQPLSAEFTREYIQLRLERVGWQHDPDFDSAVFGPIHEFSQGIPRIINQICSRLLLHGMVEEKHQLGIEDIVAVLEDLTQEALLPGLNGESDGD